MDLITIEKLMYYITKKMDWTTVKPRVEMLDQTLVVRNGYILYAFNLYNKKLA